MSKFNKNRSVSSHWLTVPLKYMLNIRGKDKPRKKKVLQMTPEEGYKQYLEWFKDEEDYKDELMSLDEFKKYYQEEVLNEPNDYKYGLKDCYKKTIPAGPDKDFAVIDIMGNHAICAWRNNNRASIGMQFTCPIIKKKKVRYLVYKDKAYKIDGTGGWVI